MDGEIFEIFLSRFSERGMKSLFRNFFPREKERNRGELEKCKVGIFEIVETSQVFPTYEYIFIRERG